jgi:hypothetical protein
MSARRFLILFLLLTVFLTACFISPSIPEATLTARADSALKAREECIISNPPPELGFSDFYSKYCNANGIPIISSGEVDDLAIQQAAYIIKNMLAPIPHAHDHLVSRKYYVAIIGKNQQQTTLPEYSHMDSEYWDQRARGLGGDQSTKITSCAEENLLCLGRLKDRYHGENILVHEFAHTIHLAAGGKEFDSQLHHLFYAALKKDLWEDTYAIFNHREYWAEGVQTYFSTNLSAHPANGVHNRINTREELAEYDPDLFAFIAEFFNNYDWTPICPED